MLISQKRLKMYNVKKGTKGKLSELGYYDYWYPGIGDKYNTEILKDVKCEHLSSWRNQGDYLAFKVPAPAVRTLVEVDPKQFVCVWIHKEDIENDK